MPTDVCLGNARSIQVRHSIFLGITIVRSECGISSGQAGLKVDLCHEVAMDFSPG